MLVGHDFRTHLERAMLDISGIIVPHGRDRDSYYESIRGAIRASLCEPFVVHAKVSDPASCHKKMGEVISAWVVAHFEGYWLAYEPHVDAYYCFWGASPENLGAYRGHGSPLFCWWG